MSALTAQLAEAWRARVLLRLMAGREIRSRFAGTALGLVWLYAQPVLTVAAYYLVFDIVLGARLAEGAPTRSPGTYLIVGMVPWMGFADGLTRAMHSLVEAGGVLQKNALPPVLFPAQAAVASAATYLPLLILAAAVFATLQGAGAAVLLLPVLIAAQAALTFLLGYALAILAAAMRDVLQFVAFCLALGVFLSPILYTVSMLPESLRWLPWLNPMTPFILGYQHIILAGKIPGPWTWGCILAWLAASALVLDRLIRRSRDQLVDWL